VVTEVSAALHEAGLSAMNTGTAEAWWLGGGLLKPSGDKPGASTVTPRWKMLLPAVQRKGK
jgi:hypothetical protein